MARYFYHIRNGLGFLRDEEGQELPNAGSVRDVAIRSIRCLIRDEVLTGHIDLAGSIEVTDENGASILIVEFRDAVEVAG